MTSRRSRSVRTAGILLGAIAWCSPGFVAAQDTRIPLEHTIPKQEYYHAYAPYWEGNFVEALKRFRQAERGGARGPQGRWVDSIPLHTMVGETLYQLGDHDGARKAYRAAIGEYIRDPRFLFRVQWEIQSVRESPRERIPWATRATPAAKPAGKTARYRESQKYLRGDVLNLPGGIRIDSRNFIGLHAIEIMRTLAVSIRRYGELMGPAARHDPLLNAKKVGLIALLEQRLTNRKHWSSAFIEVLLGCAYRAAGRDGDAAGPLSRGRVAAGQYEHPLTAIALLELGHMALEEAEFAKAGTLFEQAAIAGLSFDEQDEPSWPGLCDVLEEAFRYGAIAHRLANHRRLFAASSQPAFVSWARSKGMKFLLASLSLDSAESAVGLRDYRKAATFVGEARGLIRPGRVITSKIEARWSRLEALIGYQQGNPKAGVAFENAMKFQQRGSLWLFHIGVAESMLFPSPPAGVSERDARLLLTTVLRDPTRFDWQVRPLEALAVIMNLEPRQRALERLFELTLRNNRGGGAQALEIADAIRRHRFHASLGFGGRLLNFRWLLEAPDNQLDQDAARQRADLRAKFPDYARWSDRARALRGELAQMPLVINREEDAPAYEEQRKRFAELAKVSVAQEALLRRMAVDRLFGPLVFPPRRTTKQVQESLPKGHGMLIFFATTPSGSRPGRLYAFILTNDKDKYPTWRVRDPSGLMARASRMLKEMGHFHERRVIPLADMAEEKWKPLAEAVTTDLFTTSTGSRESLDGNLEELVIVPDASLWYLPFEALQVPARDGKKGSLIRQMRMRYAPTMSLGVPDTRGRSPGGNTAVRVGRMIPGKDEDEKARAAFEDLRRVVGGAAALSETMPGSPSVYSPLLNRLIVLDDVPTSGGPFNWRPIAAGRGTAGSTLGSWLSLPWGGPDQILLPGYHTAAENGLSERHAHGNDVFLSVCAMMGTGTRTILLSRWRTGGKTSFDLVREFAQELPHATASQAWQRSVFLSADSPLTPDLEPRVNVSSRDDPRQADHPFFWSGYLLVDTGAQPLGAAREVARNQAPGEAQ